MTASWVERIEVAQRTGLDPVGNHICFFYKTNPSRILVHKLGGSEKLGASSQIVKVIPVILILNYGFNQQQLSEAGSPFLFFWLMHVGDIFNRWYAIVFGALQLVYN